MKQIFNIKITFEQDGIEVAQIDFSAKPGKLFNAPLFGVNLKRKRIACLANSIALKLYNTLADETRIAIKDIGNDQAKA